MKKRLLMSILSICLVFSLIPAAHAEEPELLEIPDRLNWNTYYVTDLKSWEGHNFSCDIPEDGAAVLIFFSPYCMNSQNFFSSLNQCTWVDNPYVEFSASNIVDASAEDIINMVQEKALNVLEYVDVYNSRSNWMAFDYFGCISDSDILTMPLVVVLTQSDSGRMIRYASAPLRDAETVYDVLCAVSPSFADYETKKESGEVESHIHSYGGWTYTQEPTCTEAGEKARICECGAKYTSAEEALGHNTGTGTITKAPAAAETGAVSFVCTRCGETETVAIPALGNAATHSGDLNTAKPTKQALHDAWTAISDTQEYFAEAPSVTAPYATGQLTDALLESGLSYLNYVRYAANLPRLQMTGALNENAQYGAVVLAANDYMEHYPSQPEGMDDAFYEQGYYATSTSNLYSSYGYQANPLQSAVQGFMDDGGVGNMEALGHRRWLLNPVLQNVGFGYAKSLSGYEYISTKVMDKSGSAVNYDFISWPASGNFPTNLYGSEVAWSVTLNPRKYLTPDRDELVITLTRGSDGKTWLFNSGTSEPISPSTNGPVDSDTPYLTVNTDGYGVNNCTIFTPGSENIGEYRGTYTVTVSGIYLADGTPASVSYEVDFFDAASDCLDHSYTAEDVAPSCDWPGYTLYTCDLCGDNYMEYNAPALEHQFTTEEVAPTCDQQGYTLSVCGMCGLNRMTDFKDPVGHSFTSEEVPPTCAEQGYTLLTCTVCGDQRQENYVDPLGHTAVADKAVPATCSATGLTEGSHCSVCSAVLVKQETVPTLAHTEAVDKATAPSCTMPGLTEGKHCSVCSAVLVKQETVPALGHSWGQWETVKHATIQEEGQRKRTCTECGTGETQNIPKLAITFTDVPAKEYYAASVNWAVQNGITTGTSATTFSPNDKCTRAQVVTFLYRAAGEPAPTSSHNPFTDVKPGEYYYNAVLWAVEKGITTGTSATTFSPNDSCTRAQVATFLWRSQGEPGAASRNPFKDVKASEYYYNAVIWAVEKGVTTGTSATTFAPNDTCTRAQIVTFLYRALA